MIDTKVNRQTLTLIILKISLIIMNGLSDVTTTKEHSSIVNRNYGASCEIRRCSCRHKQCKTLSIDHSGALREFNYSTLHLTRTSRGLMQVFQIQTSNMAHNLRT